MTTQIMVSTFTLFAEIIISICILYSFYSGYKNNKFPFNLVATALIYEILFNISYMVYRMVSNEKSEHLLSNFALGLAIFHGIFSFIMFIALLVFMGLAWKNYKKGINYFFKHKIATFTFIFFWIIAVVSGFLFYYVIYFK